MALKATTVGVILAAALTAAGPSWAQAKPAPAPVKPPPAKPAAPPKKPAVRKPPPPLTVNPRLPKETQASQLAAHAEELQGDGFFEEAAGYFQKAAELTPDDWALWDRTGWAHLDNGQADPALKAFEASRKAAPAGTPVSGGLLVARFAAGQEAGVMELVRRMVPPEDVEKAGVVVKKGLAAKPRSADWNFALGYLYARVLGNSPRGLGPMEAVVEADPKRADAWLLLVEINQGLDRGPQEDGAAVKYLELAPETPDAFRLRAGKLAELQKFREAAAEYEEGIAKHSLAAELYYQLARLHERLGGAKPAEATYRKLLAAADEQKLPALATAARMQLANFHARQRNYPEAEKLYREAAQKPEATPTTWTTWGSLLALSGRWDEAANALEGAADRDEKERGKSEAAARDDLLAARYRAAVCRLAAGQKDAARAGLQAALALRTDVRTSPELEAAAFLNWCEAKDAKSGLLPYQKSDERWAAFTWRKTPLAEGEFEVRGRYTPTAAGWRAVLQQVQKRFPDCWPADYSLARIYAAGGFTEEALKLLEKVTARRSDWWAPQFARAQHFTQARQKDEGITALKITLRLAPECRGARTMLSFLTNLQGDDGEDQ